MGASMEPKTGFQAADDDDDDDDDEYKSGSSSLPNMLPAVWLLHTGVPQLGALERSRRLSVFQNELYAKKILV